MLMKPYHPHTYTTMFLEITQHRGFAFGVTEYSRSDHIRNNQIPVASATCGSQNVVRFFFTEQGYRNKRRLHIATLATFNSYQYRLAQGFRKFAYTFGFFKFTHLL